VTSSQRLTAATGILIFAFLGSIQALYGPLLPGLQRTFAVDTGTVGLIFTAHGLGALVGISVPSILHSASVARRWLSVASGLVTLGAGALALAPSWRAALAAAFVLALGFGIHVVRLNSVFVAGFGERSMTMTQLLNAAFSIGCIVGPVALGLAASPSQGLFGVIALFALLLTPLCALADKESDITIETTVAAERASDGRVRAAPFLCAFIVLMSLVVGVENSIAGWTTTLALAAGYTYAAAANLTALFFGCVFAGRLLAASLAHHISTSAVIIGAIACVVACLAAAVFLRSPPLAFVVTGFALAPLFAATLVWLGATVPAMRHANALVIGGALVGSALFPALVGRVIDRYGVSEAPPAILCIALAALAAAVLIQFMRRKA
jgi:fucose permease